MNVSNFDKKNMFIFKDLETGQLIRVSDRCKFCRELVDLSENPTFKVHFRGKDVTGKVRDLMYDSAWVLDDWIKGFRGRAYLTDGENRQCAFKMNQCKQDSITITDYLKEN